MNTLQGTHVFLRALEPEDLDFVYEIENDETIWELSHTQTPYSKFLIKQYLDAAHKDIYAAKQLRLVICNHNYETLGLIDIFDFDFKNKKAGIGILIQNHKDRNKGYGKEALTLLVNYCFKQLQLHQVYCNVAEYNTASLKLFSALGFETVGLKKDWNFVNGSYEHEYILQRINHH